MGSAKKGAKKSAPKNGAKREEYAVLGSRWMDCIGRVVTQPSDWEHRESTTWPAELRGGSSERAGDERVSKDLSGRASRERSRYNACGSAKPIDLHGHVDYRG